MIAGRRAGPVFLSNLRPSPARTPAAGDICPLTGRARLSYYEASITLSDDSSLCTVLSDDSWMKRCDTELKL